jgi:cytochrome b561
MSAIASEGCAVSTHYGPAAIAFHSIAAALIVSLGTLGLLFDYIPREVRSFWINVHGCVGLVYLALIIARLAWRSTHRPPDLPSDIGVFDRRISAAAHHALYALMLLVPVFGVVAYVWHGCVFDYGPFQLNFGVQMNREVFGPAETSTNF